MFFRLSAREQPRDWEGRKCEETGLGYCNAISGSIRWVNIENTLSIYLNWHVKSRAKKIGLVERPGVRDQVYP